MVINKSLIVNSNLRLYREQAGNTPPRRNHISLNSNNRTIHEFAKCLICWKALKGLPLELTTPEKEALKILDDEIDDQFKGLCFTRGVDDPSTFITEAIEVSNGKRRDVVILDRNQKIEIMCTNNSDEIKKKYEEDGVTVIELSTTPH